MPTFSRHVLVTSKLTVVAEGLEGLAASDFAATAREAEGRCPISNALRGNLTIEVEARTK